MRLMRLPGLPAAHPIAPIITGVPPMVVCHCQTVNDRRIRSAIHSGARSLDAIASDCGAGSRCGGCHQTLATLLQDCAGCQGDSCRQLAALS